MPLPSFTPVAVPLLATPTPYVPAGEFHLAVREDIKTLNPFLGTNGAERLLISLVYDTLLDPVSQVNPAGNLAHRWELHPEGRSLTFWIDPQAHWHDGLPVTADDVVYSFNLVRTQRLPGWVGLAAQVDRVEALSASEVRFSLLNNRGDILQQLGMKLPIIPAAAWDSIDDPAQFTNWDEPVGSGPFRLVQRTAGQQVVLSSVPAHHHSPARMDTLVIEIIRDEQKALQSLKNAEVDLLGWDVAPGVVSTIERQPDAYPNLVTMAAPGPVVHSLILNLRKPPFNDRDFRQALTLAIDADAIIQEVIMGYGQPALASLVPPNSPWHPGSVTPVPFDRQQAVAKLDSRGYADHDGDGVRETLEGEPLQIKIACVDLPSPLLIAQMVAVNWKAVGIAATVTKVAQDQLLPLLTEAQFDAVLYQTALRDAEAAFLAFHSSGGSINGGRVVGQNYGGYSNALYDEVVEALWEEHDVLQQQQLLAQLELALASDLPQIPLLCPYVLNLYRADRFIGWEAVPGEGLVTRFTLVGLQQR